jgi:hypothetical protein
MQPAPARTFHEGDMGQRSNNNITISQRDTTNLTNGVEMVDGWN